MMGIRLNSSMSEVEDDMDHYYHTTFLKEIGEQGQKKLLDSDVLIIGCGGLASSALTYLASTGVGHITIVDDDLVAEHNLPRQILFEYKDIGKKKVEAAKNRLEALNPDVKVTAIDKRLDEKNAEEIIKGHEIVLDCTDNFETKFLINDTCMKLGIPFVIAGVSDYQGQVCTCIPNKSHDFKYLFSVLPVNIDEKYKDEDQGVFPPAIGVISDIAASEVIKYLLGIGNLLLNKMAICNLLTNEFKVIEFPD